MSRYTFLIAFAIITLACTYTSAQHKTSYFINKTEIAPQSIQFLNVRHIDSIKTSSKGLDTTVTLYSSKRDSLVNFEKVMGDFFVEPEVRHFKINTPNYLGVEEPTKMMFSADGVSNLIVYRPKDNIPGYINISSELEHTGGKPEVREKMIELINRWNNLPKPKK